MSFQGIKNAYVKGTGIMVRFFVDKEEYGNTPYFVFRKRSRKFGRLYTEEQFNYYFEEIIEDDDYEERRLRAYKKIIKYLEASGLWNNILKRTKELIEIPYADFKKIIELSESADLCHALEEKGIKYGMPNYNSFIQKFNKSIFGEFINKYPILFNDDYSLYLEEYEYGIPKIKTMNFGGKFWNKKYRSTIEDCLKKKEKYSFQTRASYDVSFNYDPNTSRAFYSEEYRNCGNGHYYLALDSKHCLFYEND